MGYESVGIVLLVSLALFHTRDWTIITVHFPLDTTGF